MGKAKLLLYHVFYLFPLVCFGASSATDVKPMTSPAIKYMTTQSPSGPTIQAGNTAINYPLCPWDPDTSNYNAMTYLWNYFNNDALNACPDINGKLSAIAQTYASQNLCPDICITTRNISTYATPIYNYTGTTPATAAYLYEPTCARGWVQISTTNYKMAQELVPRGTVEPVATPDQVKFYQANGWSCPLGAASNYSMCLSNTAPAPYVFNAPVYDPPSGKAAYYTLTSQSCYTDPYCWYVTGPVACAYNNFKNYGYSVAYYSTCTCNQNFCYSPKIMPTTIVCGRAKSGWGQVN